MNMNAARHTRACIEARGGPDQWPTIGQLAAAGDAFGRQTAVGGDALAAVLECPHQSHDAARYMLAAAEAGL